MTNKNDNFDDDQSHIFAMIPCWVSPLFQQFNRGKFAEISKFSKMIIFLLS